MSSQQQNSQTSRGQHGPATHSKELSRAAKRINSLSELAQKIPSILVTVSSALSALSGDLDEQSTNDQVDGTIEGRKKAFEEHTRAYFLLVKTVSHTLQSEIYALEEAKILPTETQRGLGAEAAKTSNHGFGAFDIGVLNSRAEDATMQQRRRLLADAHRLLDRVSAGNQPKDATPADIQMDGPPPESEPTPTAEPAGSKMATDDD